MGQLTAWATRAINLPEHASNPIHTDVGARAAGFEAAIVAGTTIYAYLTHPPAAAWGEQWLTTGGGELKLRKAVLDHELVECNIADNDGTTTIEAQVGGEVRATFDPWQNTSAPEMRSGEDLPTLQVELDAERYGYGTRAGDDLSLYGTLAVAHPALWPSLANIVYTEHLVNGPWVHTRSRIFHQGLATLGDRLTISSTVIDRFETRSGSRAVTDIAIATDDGRPLVRIEHEALVELNEG